MKTLNDALLFLFIMAKSDKPCVTYRRMVAQYSVWTMQIFIHRKVHKNKDAEKRSGR